MQQYCGCYGLLLRYMPKNVLFVTYSRSISQPHTRLTITERSRDSGQSISIHSLIRGWPSGCPTLYNSVLLFNSQPHTRLTGYRLGVDCRIAFQFARGYLSIHSLIRGWPKFRSFTLIQSSLSIHSLIRGWPCFWHCFPLVVSLSIHSLIRGWPIVQI